MAKSKTKVAAKPVKKSIAPKKKPVKPKVAKAPAKKVKPAPKKTVSSPAKKVVKPVDRKGAKPVAKAISKSVAKPKVKQILKKLITPIVKVMPKVLGKPVVKPIVKLPAHAPKNKAAELRTRYSDTELEEFKHLIIEKLDVAKKELRYLQDQINRKGDNGTDDTENKFASSDDGSSSMEREYLNQMAARQIMYLDHLDKALVRIQNKTYGICRVTGKLIEKDRLKAVPHATLSMEAKLLQSHS